MKKESNWLRRMKPHDVFMLVIIMCGIITALVLGIAHFFLGGIR